MVETGSFNEMATAGRAETVGSNSILPQPCCRIRGTFPVLGLFEELQCLGGVAGFEEELSRSPAVSSAMEFSGEGSVRVLAGQ